MQIAARQLWLYCRSMGEDSHRQYEEASDGITEEVREALRKLDLDVVVASREMSESDIGGDELLSYIDQAVRVMEAGYRLFNWYGPDTEVLSVGYRPGQLRVDVAVEPGAIDGEPIGVTVL